MRNRLNLPLPKRCSLYQALLWVSDCVSPIDDTVFDSLPVPESPTPTVDDKRQLLRVIMSGHLKATGICRGDKEFQFDEPEGETVDLEIYGWEEDEIEWEQCSKRSGGRSAATDTVESITVATDELMKLFPPPPDSGKLTADTPRTGSAGENSSASKPTRSGRPRSYDWDNFYIEIAVRADLDGLPESLAELERMMADWCDENWNRTPAESVIREKISPIYNHIRKAGK